MTISGADLDAVIGVAEKHRQMDGCRKCEMARRRSDTKKMCALGWRTAGQYGRLQDALGIEAEGNTLWIGRLA